MTPQAPQARTLEQLASAVEYTDLRKEITYRDVETMLLEAEAYGLRAIVVPSALVRRATALSTGSRPAIGSAISYPFGSQSARVKAREASTAVEHGASELDIAPHFGAILAERWQDVRNELTEIHRASGGALLKLCLEIDLLSSAQIRETCSIAADCGFSLVCNTLSFRVVSIDPEAQGAASVEKIRALHALVGDSLRLKASGGVSTREQIGALLDAGAERVAVSAAPGVLRNMGWGRAKGDPS